MRVDKYWLDLLKSSDPTCVTSEDAPYGDLRYQGIEMLQTVHTPGPRMVDTVLKKTFSRIYAGLRIGCFYTVVIHEKTKIKISKLCVLRSQQSGNG